MEIGDVSLLSNIYKDFKNIKIAKTKVKPTNIVSLLEGFEINKDFGFLNLDIDSFDYQVLEKLLEGGYRPAVASIEINETIPPPVFYYAKYSEKNHEYSVDYFFGCSLTAANYLMSKFEYSLSHIYGNNAFFLNKKHFDIFEKSEIHIYRKGYIELENRESIYSYNRRVDLLIEEEPHEICNFLNNLWENKQTNYVLKVRDQE